MRKVISILAVFALVGSVAAAPKKAPAKPVKPAVAAPAVTAPIAAVAAKSSAPSGGAKFTITAWGGYSINGKSDLYTGAESFGSSTENTTSGFASKASDVKNMGFASGADFWYGGAFQVGLGGYYSKGFSVAKVGTYTNGTIVSGTTMDYVPIFLQARYFIFDGVYAGVGGGIALVLKGESTAALTGTLTSTGIPYTDSYTNMLIVFNGRVGYVLNITDLIGIDVFGIFTYQIGKVTYKDVDSTGSS